MAELRRSSRRSHAQRAAVSSTASSSTSGTDASAQHGLRSGVVSDNDLVSVVPHVASSSGSSTGYAGSARTDQPEPSTASTSPPSTGSAKPKRVRVMTDRRREQCRVNQARYRKKQTRSDADLEVAVSRLKMDVIHLEDRRRTLYHAMNTRESCAQVIVEYFRLFRHGYSPSVPVRDQQAAFVMTNFDPHVRVGEINGSDAFLELTRVFSVFYDNPCTDLIRLLDWSASDTDTMLNTTLRTELTVSNTTIREVFPHLLHPEHSRLRQKLLGQRLSFDAWGRFVFDDSGKILEYHWGMDFIGVLQKILTLEETAIVLGRAQLASDGSLPEVSIQEDRFEIV